MDSYWSDDKIDRSGRIITRADIELYDRNGDLSYDEGPYYFQVSLLGNQSLTARYVAVDRYDEVVQEEERRWSDEEPLRIEFELDEEERQDPDKMAEAIIQKLEEPGERTPKPAV